MRVLITGGAGYIGSITTKKILETTSHQPLVLDNLERGNRGAVEILSCPFIKADLRNKTKLKSALEDRDLEAVIHFAAYCAAGESMDKPLEYFVNNVQGSLNLLEVMRDLKIPKIIFSSSCSIYGTPQELPVKEKAPENPESVYAESKRIVEKYLKWFAHSYQFKTIALRYFNACGALMDGTMGEYKQPFTTIIPLALNALLKKKSFTVFGDDYPTPDGTCIRDYVHVEDLARAHIQALEKIESTDGFDYFNLGVGKGFSVKEIVQAIKQVTKKDFPVKIGPRRPGDPAAIYGDNTKAKEVLDWRPRFGLEEIIKSAYRWHKSHPHGYQSLEKEKSLPVVEERKII